ncbi:hypothetical protein Tco_1069496 [Tanacetum coccineum]|uniref:Uncharacterized protein n=1 Tax=Tanacetum coccineum TaxID=301880 RepID=A0ABQ5HK48_9ASTR
MFPIKPRYVPAAKPGTPRMPMVQPSTTVYLRKALLQLLKSISEASHSNSVNIDVTPNNQLPHVQKWTQAHPLENIIGDKDRPVSTRKQLETDAMWCFFNEFLTHIIILHSRSNGIFKIKLMNMETLEEQSSVIGRKVIVRKLYEAWHLPMDVKNRLPATATDEVVYVSQPEGFVESRAFLAIVPPQESSLWSQTSSTSMPKPTEMHLTAKKRIFGAVAQFSGCLLNTVASKHMISQSLYQEQFERKGVELYFSGDINNQLADIFTKAITREALSQPTPLLGVKQMSPEL